MVRHNVLDLTDSAICLRTVLVVYVSDFELEIKFINVGAKDILGISMLLINIYTTDDNNVSIVCFVHKRIHSTLSLYCYYYIMLLSISTLIQGTLSVLLIRCAPLVRLALQN